MQSEAKSEKEYLISDKMVLKTKIIKRGHRSSLYSDQGIISTRRYNNSFLCNADVPYFIYTIIYVYVKEHD
jgi:hypothetical protein